MDGDLKLDPAIKATYRHVCGVEMSADAVGVAHATVSLALAASDRMLLVPRLWTTADEE